MDQEPSHGDYHLDTTGPDLLWLLDVAGSSGVKLGRLALRTHGDMSTGRLSPDGIAIVFPDDEE